MIYLAHRRSLTSAAVLASILIGAAMMLLGGPALAQEQTTPLAATEGAQTPLPSPPVELPPADNPLSLTLSPVTLLIETDPEKPVTSSFQVLNNADKAESLKVSLMKFSADQTGAAPVIKPFEAGDNYQQWLHFSPSSFVVEPKTWKTVQVTFSPPKEAALSYYYAIVVSRQTPTSAPEGETSVVGAPAILALTTVRSPFAKQELQLKSFRATKRVFEFLPVEFEVVVQNTGNIHLAPVGNIFISSGSEKDIGQIQINRTNGLILPGSTRTYILKWEEGFPLFVPKEKDGAIVVDEQGKPKKRLNWDFSKANLFRMGKFTGHLVFIYDNGERDIPSEAIVTFFVLPWRIIGVGLAMMVLVMLGITMPIIWLVKRTNKTRSPK